MTKPDYATIIDNDFQLKGDDYDRVFMENLEDLGHPDPDLRDELAYPVLYTWIERSYISDACKVSALNELTGLSFLLYKISECDDAYAVKRTFTCLIISALLEADNASSYLDASQVRHVLHEIIRYVETENVDTGFSDVYGWVHAKAHAADVMRELFPSTKLSEAEKKQLSQCICQIFAKQESLFLFREDERLCKAVMNYQGNNERFVLQHLEDFIAAFPTKNLLYQKKNNLVKYLQTSYFHAWKRNIENVCAFCLVKIDELMYL